MDGGNEIHGISGADNGAEIPAENMRSKMPSLGWMQELRGKEHAKELSSMIHSPWYLLTVEISHLGSDEGYSRVVLLHRSLEIFPSTLIRNHCN